MDHVDKILDQTGAYLIIKAGLENAGIPKL